MFFVRCGSVFFFKAPFLEHKFGGFLKIKTCKLRNNMICLVHITIVGMRHVKIIYASCESCAYTLASTTCSYIMSKISPSFSDSVKPALMTCRLGLLLCDVDLPSLAIRNLELLWQTAEPLVGKMVKSLHAHSIQKVHKKLDQLVKIQRLHGNFYVKFESTGGQNDSFIHQVTTITTMSPSFHPGAWAHMVQS